MVDVPVPTVVLAVVVFPLVVDSVVPVPIIGTGVGTFIDDFQITLTLT